MPFLGPHRTFFRARTEAFFGPRQSPSLGPDRRLLWARTEALSGPGPGQRLVLGLGRGSGRPGQPSPRFGFIQAFCCLPGSPWFMAAFPGFVSPLAPHGSLYLLSLPPASPTSSARVLLSARARRSLALSHSLSNITTTPPSLALPASRDGTRLLGMPLAPLGALG